MVAAMKVSNIDLIASALLCHFYYLYNFTKRRRSMRAFATANRRLLFLRLRFRGEELFEPMNVVKAVLDIGVAHKRTK